jgi:hypothetical protein
VFIDEIQEIDRFELALRSLFAEGRYDLYCTGSNVHCTPPKLRRISRFLPLRQYFGNPAEVPADLAIYLAIIRAAFFWRVTSALI